MFVKNILKKTLPSCSRLHVSMSKCKQSISVLKIKQRIFSQTVSARGNVYFMDSYYDLVIHPKKPDYSHEPSGRDEYLYQLQIYNIIFNLQSNRVMIVLNKS